jgi:hypothetical protein
MEFCLLGTHNSWNPRTPFSQDINQIINLLPISTLNSLKHQPCGRKDKLRVFNKAQAIPIFHLFA